MTNILIGVGGTGAKVVEAAMLLVAAGLGPDELYVGIVDQDNANGNVERARTLVSDYIRFRRLWDGSTPGCRIDWRGNGRDQHPLDFCRTDVRQLFGESSSWCPGGDQTTLRGIIGQNLSETQSYLFDLLFTPDEDEQDLPLGEGYRGRAHVGSAALIERLSDPDNPLTRAVSPLMAGQGGGERVNIFIAGSAFGGTGAAGFPTIAREINRIRSNPEFTNAGKVAIGGALMLPYFGFAPADPRNKSKVVSTDELIPKAQLALEHYANLFATERAFDLFYLVGFDEFFPLGYHKEGNAEQCNPPLLPELVAASAAFEFLNKVHSPGAAQTPRIMTAAREDRRLRLGDLPLDRDARERLIHLFRFALYWRYVASDMMEARKPILGRGNWTHHLRGKHKKEIALPALEALQALLDKILLYGAQMQALSPDHWGGGLWNLTDLHDRSHQPTPQEPVRLTPYHPAGARLFDDALRQEDGEAYGRDAGAVFGDLETHPTDHVRGDHDGFGKVLAAAFEATALRNKEAADAPAQ